MRVMVLVKAKAGIMPSTGEGLHPSGECRLCLIPRQPKSRRERELAHDASGAHPRGTDGSNPVPSSGESGANARSVPAPPGIGCVRTRCRSGWSRRENSRSRLDGGDHGLAHRPLPL
jgi:hypothetical protein